MITRTIHFKIKKTLLTKDFNKASKVPTLAKLLPTLDTKSYLQTRNWKMWKISTKRSVICVSSRAMVAPPTKSCIVGIFNAMMIKQNLPKFPLAGNVVTLSGISVQASFKGDLVVQLGGLSEHDQNLETMKENLFNFRFLPLRRSSP